MDILIGDKIKLMRLKHGLTQKELADRCELSKGFISLVESDQTIPSLTTLADILEVVYALGALKGVTACELEQMRAKKSEARGGFEKKIFLHSVIEEK